MTRTTDEENVHSNLRENRVRWKGDNGSASTSTSAAPSAASSLAASTPTTKPTPSKKFSSKKKFREDAVAAYHFAGVPNTPWSKKKHRGHRGEDRKRGEREDGRGYKNHDRGNSSSGNEQKQQSIGDKEINSVPLENTFNLGGTASLASIYGDLNASTLSGLSHLEMEGDRLDLSLASSKSGLSASSGMSVESDMNRTTLSDTHELSTSNFILSNRVRGVISERAKMLGLGEAREEWIKMKECVGDGVGSGLNGKGASESKDKEEIEFTSQERGTPQKKTMLDDSTASSLGLNDLLSTQTIEHILIENVMAAEQTRGKTVQNESNDTEEDEGIEFTSHQRSTPKKKELAMVDDSTASSLGLNDLLSTQTIEHILIENVMADQTEGKTVQNEPGKENEEDEGIEFTSHQRSTPKKKELAMVDDSTASSLGLNELLDNPDDSKKSEESEAKTGELSVSINGGTVTDWNNYLDGVLNGGDAEKSAGIETDKTGDVSVSFGQGSPKSDEGNANGEQSFVESTASQNYLDGVLNEGDKICTATSKQSPAVQASTPNTSQITNSNLRQSPSFLSGKKKTMPWRKSTGGDELAKMRALTASLKKKNREKFGRVSLPAPKNGVLAQVSAKETGTGEKAAKDSARALFSEAEEPASPTKSPSEMQVDSPVRNTRSGKRDAASPAKSPSKSTKKAKSSPSKTIKENDVIEFTSHQRSTPGKQNEVSMLDNSSTASSLGLNDLFANLEDSADKSNMECEEPVTTKPSPKKPPKSPSKDQYASPVRNTRRSKRDSPSPSMDSPARNTRSGGKSPAKSPSKSVDSPARNTRSSPKRSPAKSPSKSADSPSRNTRSAKKSSESSPARSLFTSTLSPSAFNQLESPAKKSTSPAPMDVSGQGTFSGRKRTSLSPSSESRKPLKKRTSFTLSPSSEPSDGLSLSKEYPFLNINNEESLSSEKSPAEKPASKDVSALGKSPEPTGTNTLMFNNLMNDIQGMAEKSYISEDSNNADVSSGLSSFGDDMSVSSAKQSRNKRRETADFTDLVGILADGSKEATLEITPPPAKLQTPRGSASKTPTSILNSNKGKRSARNVMFGALETAEYNIGSPSASFTPVARSKFTNASDEVEQTTELEGDITQMIAKASDPSLMGPIDESRIEGADFPSDASSIGFSSGKGSCQFVERTEELETNIFSLVGAGHEEKLNNSEESEFSLPSISEDSEGTPHNVKLAGRSISGMSSMDIEETAQVEGNLSAMVRESSGVSAEATQTVAIEGTIASLLDAVSNHDSKEVPREDSQTMEIEGTIGSLLDAVEDDSALPTQTIEIEGTVASLLGNVEADRAYQDMSFKQSRQSLPASKPAGVQECNWTYSTLSIPLDSNVEALVDGASKQSQTQDEAKQMASQSFEEKTGTEMPENTETLSLDANSAQLMANTSSASSERDTIQFSKEHASGDDDASSISTLTLGMGTSHELSNNSEMQSSLSKIAEEEPLEPVDLKMEELLEHSGNEVKLDADNDVMLNALNVTSRNVSNSIKKETTDILSQVCSDIESQISIIDVESDFSVMVERKEDMFRALQRKLWANDVETTAQLSAILQSANASILSEWDSWVNQVAGLYNEQLQDTAVGELEKDSLSIADKTSDINYKREQVALPMLLQSAKRATKRNYQRQQAEKAHLDDEVGQLKAELKKVEIELAKLQQKRQNISGIAESNQQSDALSKDAKMNRRRADSAFYKFFNLEKLHNWIITSSNDSYISIVSNGPSSETHLHLSFWITESSNTAFDCKVGPVTRAVNSLVGEKQVRYHPAVTGFLKSKMALLCQDLKENTRLDSASKISSLIISVEHKVARIQQAAKEFDAILSQCKNSFLQPSDTLKDGFDFHAYITRASRPGARVEVRLTLSDSYPFAPIGVSLHSTDSSLNTESMTRKLKKAIKPGFGALSKAIDALNGLLD